LLASTEDDPHQYNYLPTCFDYAAAGSALSDIGRGADLRSKRRALADTPRDRFASNRPMFGSPRRGSPQSHPCPIAESLKYPLPQRNSSATPDSSEVSVPINQNDNPPNLHQLSAS
jgi:hypothetical protein